MKQTAGTRGAVVESSPRSDNCSNQPAAPSTTMATTINRHKQPCDGQAANNYCMHGGTCYTLLGVQSCVCTSFYSGPRCTEFDFASLERSVSDKAAMTTTLSIVIPAILFTVLAITIIIVVAFMLFKRSRERGHMGRECACQRSTSMHEALQHQMSTYSCHTSPQTPISLLNGHPCMELKPMRSTRESSMQTEPLSLPQLTSPDSQYSEGSANGILRQKTVPADQHTILMLNNNSQPSLKTEKEAMHVIVEVASNGSVNSRAAGTQHQAV